MNRLLSIAAAVAVALGVFWYVYPRASNPTLPPISIANAQDAIVDTSGILEMSIGNPDAKVTVIEYASFTCPHCRNFHASVFGRLKSDYIDSGKINCVYREVYFDRFGLWAGMVARCGGPLRYFGISDMLYEQQSEWLAGGEPPQIVANLRQIGKVAGLTDEALDTCLNDGNKARALVALYQQNSEADDINSTPSFVINGQKYSNMNYADFSTVIDEKLAE